MLFATHCLGAILLMLNWALTYTCVLLYVLLAPPIKHIYALFT